MAHIIHYRRYRLLFLLPIVFSAFLLSSFETHSANDPYTLSLFLNEGWNLISIPATSKKTIENIFVTGNGKSVKKGNIWYWNGNQFVMVSDTDFLSEDKAYWIFSVEEISLPIVTEFPAKKTVAFQAMKWKTTGPILADPPPGTTFSEPVWFWEKGSFKALPSSGPFFLLQGYYMYSLSDGEANIRVPPIADAGADQNVTGGMTVTLDARASFDPYNKDLTYTWRLLSSPPGSSATLSNLSEEMPSFFADLEGQYQFELVVANGMDASPPATVTLNAKFLAPTITGSIANVGVAGGEIVISGENLNPLAGGTSITFNGIEAPIRTIDNTSISVVVPFGATDGKIEITTAGGKVTVNDNFTVNLSRDFSLSVKATTATVIQGDRVSYAITVITDADFSDLVSLSIDFLDLPQGNAVFTRETITTDQTVFLNLAIEDALPADNYSFKIMGSTIIDDRVVTREIALQLIVLAKGGTHLTGQVVTDDELQKPIPNVTMFLLSDPQNMVLTDGSGNFLLQDVEADDQVLVLNASTATIDGIKYASVTSVEHLVAGETNRVAVLLHLPLISDGDTFATPPNNTEDIIVETPTIPNMTVTIPIGTVITSPDGSTIIDEITVVPLTVDRSPMLLPPGIDAGFIFTIQPEGAIPSNPVPIEFPNVTGIDPGTTGIKLFMLDVDLGDFVQYGTGTVSLDGTKIVADIDPNTGRPFGLTKFGWHFTQNPEDPSPRPGDEPGGDPVDMATGSFISAHDDIAINGLLTPITIIRTYRTFNSNAGPFGIGTSLNWNIRLRIPNGQAPGNAQSLFLVLPGNNRQIFAKQANGIFINTTDPTLSGAVISGNISIGPVSLRMKDGSEMHFNGFPGNGGLANGKLIRLLDRNSNAVSISRDSRGNPSTITDAVGRSLKLTFDSVDRITSIFDPMGRVVRYSYDANGMLENFTDPEGNVEHYAYDDQNRIIEIIDKRGITSIINIYGDDGRVISQETADGGITTFDYELSNPRLPTSRVVSCIMTNPLGHTTTCRFNSSGTLVSIKDALGQTTRFIREISTNRLVAVSDPLKNRTRRAYDNAGNLMSITDALGQITSLQYDPIFNQITNRTDALNQTTTFSYDSRGNIIKVTDPLGNSTTFSYNELGQQTSITDALGKTTTYDYDKYGNIVDITDPMGNKEVLTYDGISRLTSVADPLGSTTYFTYNQLDFVVERKNPLGGITSFQFDDNSNLLSVIDPVNNTTSYAYDAKNRLVEITDPLGEKSLLSYDFSDNVTMRVNRRGETNNLDYDALNRLVETSYADGNISKYRYDALGNILLATNTKGGFIDLRYDRIGRIIKQLTPVGKVEYTYDEVGRRKLLELPQQSPISYAYDRKNRLEQLSQDNHDLQFVYDAIDRMTHISRSNDVETNLDYNQQDQITRILHQTDTIILSDLRYDYDAVGNRIGWQTEHGYPLATKSKQFTIGASNRVISYGDEKSDITYDYDQEGNPTRITTSSGITELSWDSRNQLIAIKDSNNPLRDATFCYDAFGRRIEKTVNGITKRYLYDFKNIVKEVSLSGEETVYLSGFGLDEVYASVSRTEDYYFHHDALGSISSLSDATGNIQTRYNYEPYGETVTDGKITGNPFQFTSRENDLATSFYYYRARYYNPVTGRFLSEDPIGFRGGTTNLYQYVKNNPINFTDPTGEIIPVIIGIGIGLSVLTYAILDSTHFFAKRSSLQRASSIEDIERLQNPANARKREQADAAFKGNLELLGAINNATTNPRDASSLIGAGVGITVGVHDALTGE